MADHHVGGSCTALCVAPTYTQRAASRHSEQKHSTCTSPTVASPVLHAASHAGKRDRRTPLRVLTCHSTLWELSRQCNRWWNFVGSKRVQVGWPVNVLHALLRASAWSSLGGPGFTV